MFTPSKVGPREMQPEGETVHLATEVRVAGVVLPDALAFRADALSAPGHHHPPPRLPLAALRAYPPS